MSLLDIRVLGDPVLRQETKVVTEVTPELRRLVDDMFETMYLAKGIGLAAPQVGRTERLAVIDVDDSRFVLFNPEIIAATRRRSKAEEGCLSIPDDLRRRRATGPGTRPRDGPRRQNIRGRGRDLLARCLQHEIDHLHGKLFIDYLSVFKRRSAIAKWAKEKEKYPGLR